MIYWRQFTLFLLVARLLLHSFVAQKYLSVPFCNLNLSSILTMRNKTVFLCVLSAIFFHLCHMASPSLVGVENSFLRLSRISTKDTNRDVDRKRRKIVELLNKLIIRISFKHLAVTLTSAFNTERYSSYVSGSVFAFCFRSTMKSFSNRTILSNDSLQSKRKENCFIQLKFSVFHYAADQ
jgi:hypothetical protein